MTQSLHPIEALHDAVSGRLSDEARARLDAHLATCEVCRREYEAMTWLTPRLAAAADRVEAPPDLAVSLSSALEAEDAASSSAAAPRVTRRTWLLIGGSAAAAAVGAVVVGRLLDEDVDVPASAADAVRAYAAGDLPLDLRTSEPPVLAAHFDAADPGFASDVYDFAMMAYRLEGGGVHAVAGHTSTMAAYRGEGALRLVCQMYPGRLDDLPPPDRRLTRAGVAFLVYDEGGITVVCWQSGPLVCVLAANGDPEAAIALAVAKGTPA